jgi:transcriptional regulator with XRE-family HTH domain
MMKTTREKRMKLRLLAAKRIRQIREGKGLSQEGLADIAELHRTYVSSVERGERNVTVDSLERLADALGVDIRAFFEPE